MEFPNCTVKLKRARQIEPDALGYRIESHYFCVHKSKEFWARRVGDHFLVTEGRTEKVDESTTDALRLLTIVHGLSEANRAAYSFARKRAGEWIAEQEAERQHFSLNAALPLFDDEAASEILGYSI